MFDLCNETSLELNNETYSTSGFYIQELTSAQGCDSIISIELSLEQSVTEEINLGLCDDEIVQVYGLEIETAGTYEAVLLNQNGCDTLINIIANVWSSTEGQVDLFLCENESLDINSQSFSQAGQYQQTLVNKNGCDSLLTIDLIEAYPTNADLQIEICQGQSVELNNQNFSESGICTQVLTNLTGCDSIISIELISNDIYIPNIITMGSNDANSGFGIFTNCSFDFYELTIYDRWGNEIFVSQESMETWKGWINQKKAAQGIYTFVIQYGSENEEEKNNLVGDFLLIR